MMPKDVYPPVQPSRSGESAQFGDTWQRVKPWFAHWRRGWASILIVALVLNHGILAETGYKSFEALREFGSKASFDPVTFAVIVFFSLTLLFCTWQLASLGERLLDFSAKVTDSDGVYAHSVLILHLSARQNDRKGGRGKATRPPVSPTFVQWESQATKAGALLDKIGRASAPDTRSAEHWIEALQQVCASAGPFDGWNWQQPLRVILHDLKRSVEHPSRQLREIVVTVSDKSQHDFPAFEALISPFLASWPLGPIALIRVRDTIPDLEVDQIAKRLAELIDEAVKRHGGKDRKKRIVCIDATAGQKPFSIGAALATLNRDMAFVYVDNGGTPHFFNANVSGIKLGAD